MIIKKNKTKTIYCVIPAKAGIQTSHLLDARLRGHDGFNYMKKID